MLSDMVVLYVMQMRHLYYQVKYQVVNDEDDSVGESKLNHSEEVKAPMTTKVLRCSHLPLGSTSEQVAGVFPHIRQWLIHYAHV